MGYNGTSLYTVTFTARIRAQRMDEAADLADELVATLEDENILVDLDDTKGEVVRFACTNISWPRG